MPSWQNVKHSDNTKKKKLSQFILLGEYPKQGLPAGVAHLKCWSNDATPCNTAVSLLYEENAVNQHRPQYCKYYPLLWRRMWLWRPGDIISHITNAHIINFSKKETVLQL